MYKVPISVVIPCFNEEKVILETLERIKIVSEKLNKFEWELILIDDGSSDNTKRIIQDINEYPFKIILLSFITRRTLNAKKKTHINIIK